MDLYIDRDELLRGLARVQGIVERRTTNPSLAHVLLSASGDRLRLTATDTLLALVWTQYQYILFPLIFGWVGYKLLLEDWRHVHGHGSTRAGD